MTINRLTKLLFFAACLGSLSTGAATIHVTVAEKTTTAETVPLRITMEDSNLAVFSTEEIQDLGESGEPQIPWKVIRLLVPPNVDLDSVSPRIVSEEYTQVDGVWDVAPIPPIFTLNENDVKTYEWPEGQSIAEGRNTAIYSVDALWPFQKVRIAGTGMLRSWKLVEVAIPLVRFNPVTGEMQQLISMDVALDYAKETQDKSKLLKSVSVKKGNQRTLDRVENITDNADDFIKLYNVEKTPASKMPDPNATGYLLCVPTRIQSSLGNTLDRFIAHKESLGFTVHLISQEETGARKRYPAEAALKFRTWLQNNYLTLDLKYVLIIDYPYYDKTYSYFPMVLFPCGERNIGTDYFYAELSCDWDKDEDGIIGELASKGGDNGDEIERYYELYVGRISNYKTDDTISILEKTMTYETEIDISWRYNAFLPMMPTSGSAESYNLGEDIKSDLLEPRGISSDRSYVNGYGRTPTDYPIIPPAEFDSSVYPADAWSAGGKYGLVVWMTHGMPTEAAGIIKSGQVKHLNDTHPSTTFQGSCLNGSINTPTNLGYSLLVNGAIVTHSASRSSYASGNRDFSKSPGASGLTYRYARGIAAGKSCGAAFWDMKEETASWWWHNWTVFNTYGDPSVVVFPHVQPFSITPTDLFYTHLYEDEEKVTATRSYSITNASDTVINWTATKTATWFDLSATSGTIPAGGTASVNVTLNTEIEEFSVGNYEDVIFFANTTSGETFERKVHYGTEWRLLPKSKWKVCYVDSEATSASRAFDGRTSRYWSSEGTAFPHEIQIDLQTRRTLQGFIYLPRQDTEDGRIANYEFYASNHTNAWGAILASGTFPNTAEKQTVLFDELDARYIRFVALSEVNGESMAKIAELDMIYKADGLKGHWKMDEATGENARDSVGYGLDASSDDVSLLSEIGQIDGALDFNGTNAFAETKYTLEPNVSDLTITGWIRPSDLFSEQSILSKKDCFTLKLSGSSIRLTTPYKRNHTSSSVCTSNQWQFVAVTFTPSTSGGCRFYRNGIFLKSVNSSEINSYRNRHPLLLGKNQWGQFFGGGLDDIRCYDRVLSASEIDAIYHQTEDYYANWKANQFTPEQLADPAISGDTANADGDALPNLLEYALGFDPQNHDSKPFGAIMEMNGTDQWGVEFNQYSNRKEIDLMLEWSSSLSSNDWKTIARSTAGGSITVHNGATVFSETGSNPTTIKMNVSTNATGFIRWKASKR